MSRLMTNYRVSGMVSEVNDYKYEAGVFTGREFGNQANYSYLVNESVISVERDARKVHIPRSKILGYDSLDEILNRMRKILEKNSNES